MATAATGWLCTHSASIIAETDSTATIRVYCYWKNNGWTYNINYVSAWVYCNGATYKVKDSGSIDAEGSSSQQVSCGYHDFIIDKASAAQSISCYAKITSSSSYVSGTKTSTASSVTVAKKTSYTVDYDANGGSGAPSAQTKWYGTNLTLSSTIPTRTGYTFVNWLSSTQNKTYTAGALYGYEADTTMVAQWKANTYTVTYNANGGNGAPSNQTKTHGTALTLSSTTPIREGYNFLGWGTSASATTVVYAPGATYNTNAAITLYAVWEVAYLKPRISDLTVSRCDSSGTVMDNGTYSLVTFDWETDENVTEILIEWTAAGDTGSASISASGTSGSVSKIVGGSLDVDTTYDITVYVTDSDTTNATATLNGTAFSIDFLAGGNGAAFGKPASKPNALEIGWTAYDRFDTLFGNGLAAYTGSGDNGIDPDTTLEPLILTMVNTPISGQFMYIATVFYSTKSATTNRAQYALPYKVDGNMYHRYYSGGAWSEWQKHINASDILDLVYPVGTYYIAHHDTSPAELFGGTWHRIESRFLWAAPSTSTIGLTAGEQTHTLTTSEMPSHRHEGVIYSGNGKNIALNTGSSGYKLSWSANAGSDVNEIITNYTGGGAAHNNMPPYVNVAIWRRTA